jgi:mono/diheme cytochrome c family protein
MKAIEGTLTFILAAAALSLWVVSAAFAVSAEGSKPERVISGKQLYTANCGGCHQPDGGGVPMMQPELIASERANGPVGGVIIMILKGSNAIEPGMSEYSNEMPAFDRLTDTEIALIATYVRTHFENTGGSVTADDVRTRRSK